MTEGATARPERRLGPDVDTLESAVFQSLGAASSCWESLAGAGVFESDRCKAVADELLEWIRERFVPASVAEQAIVAFRFTREYVGEALLPPLEGWSWWEAVVECHAALGWPPPDPRAWTPTTTVAAGARPEWASAGPPDLPAISGFSVRRRRWWAPWRRP